MQQYSRSKCTSLRQEGNLSCVSSSRMGLEPTISRPTQSWARHQMSFSVISSTTSRLVVGADVHFCFDTFLLACRDRINQQLVFRVRQHQGQGLWCSSHCSRRKSSHNQPCRRRFPRRSFVVGFRHGYFCHIIFPGLFDRLRKIQKQALDQVIYRECSDE